ncbi:hypothetical protein K435DRAFT_795280 [Dendrothele bispora CBS 962.96]|uniref:Peptidase C14 caspase domain-containing protein n=1 Tax=Dendrothele bispora (strain CBS 962.96) TaxID=1314807 RepID=A0A4S8MA03_DENBC|nr:hypothetical protein K435DRAFT_795280 [Dendrothele bispora CBS 962.96]
MSARNLSFEVARVGQTLDFEWVGITANFKLENSFTARASPSNVALRQWPSLEAFFDQKQTHLVITYPLPSQKRLYALVIGVDSYMHADGHRLKNLHGCVNDAKDVALFIHEQYNVPRSQITLLLNEQATRVNIKRYIQDFITLPQFAVNDAFVIFIKNPENTNAGKENETIEMLLPYDFAPWTSDQENEQGIPNSTLVPLLRLLAVEKGPNIIVILDCCHSSFITRVNREGADKIDLNPVGNEEVYTVRSVQLPEDYIILSSIDEDVVDMERKSVLYPLKTSIQGTLLRPFVSEMTGQASHTLLAACGKDQTAKEMLGRGQFTSALMAYMRDPTVDITTVTFRDIIESLPKLQGQTPHVYGPFAVRTQKLIANHLLTCDPSEIASYVRQRDRTRRGLKGGGPEERNMIRNLGLESGLATFDGCIIG